MTFFRRLISLVFASALLLNATPAYSDKDDDNYDRLDGHGLSGKKVDVIEWEGNLEIHVYPVGSLKGLALKLDKRDKNKPVMVIGYRFDNDPKSQLIRRAILGIPFNEGFKAYRDKSADDYDKIIVSNNTQSGQVVAFKLDPEPTQLYPDGHPMNEQKKPEGKRGVASVKKGGKRKVATQGAEDSADDGEKADKSGSADGEDSDPDGTSGQSKSQQDEEGRIKPFFQ